MSEFLEERDAKFLRYWEERREKKRRFYLMHILGWGLIGGNLAYFLSIDFKLDQFTLVRYLLYVIFWVLGGLFWAHVQYRGQERQYKKLRDRNEN